MCNKISYPSGQIEFHANAPTREHGLPPTQGCAQPQAVNYQPKLSTMSSSIKTLDIYTKGTRAWFPDEREGWMIGLLSSFEKTATTVKMSFSVGNTVVCHV